MARPEDYGDQFPSDTGDTKPESPTTGFAETNANILQAARSVQLGKTANVFDPNFGFEESFDQIERPLHGFILEEVTDTDAQPRVFKVMLANGENVIAKALTLTKDKNFDDFQHVPVFPSMKKNEFVIPVGPGGGEAEEHQAKWVLGVANENFTTQTAEFDITVGGDRFYDGTDPRINIDEATDTGIVECLNFPKLDGTLNDQTNIRDKANDLVDPPVFQWSGNAGVTVRAVHDTVEGDKYLVVYVFCE